jgi:hypothetical protein
MQSDLSRHVDIYVEMEMLFFFLIQCHHHHTNRKWLTQIHHTSNCWRCVALLASFLSIDVARFKSKQCEDKIGFFPKMKCTQV